MIGAIALFLLSQAIVFYSNDGTPNDYASEDPCIKCGEDWIIISNLEKRTIDLEEPND